MNIKRSFLSSVFSVITVFIVVIIVLIDKPDYNFFNLVYRGAVPVTQAAGQLFSYPVRMVGKIVKNIQKGRKNILDNEITKAKLDDFDKINSENEFLHKENELLRKKLKMTSRIKQKTVVANIIHNNGFLENQSFIAKNLPIDVIKGNIVLSNNGFLLGVLSEKIEDFAKIQSLRDAKSNTPVRIAGTEVFGFLQGLGTNDAELRFLSNSDFEIESGMFLITSGVNGNIPENIPVGRIKAADKDKIKVDLGAELNKQEAVVILLFDRNEKYN